MSMPNMTPEELRPKPTDSEQLETVVGFLLGETMLDGMWFGDQDSSKPHYWWRTKLRAALQERDQQRLSEMRKLKVTVYMQESPQIQRQKESRNRAIDACIALITALGPDNSKTKEDL